jgi:spore coat protein CotF
MNNNLTEKDLMHDLLATEKQVISGYSVGITETSCPNLRNTLVDNFRSAQDTQYKVFDAMRQKGWYQIKDAQEQDVQKAKDDANTMMNELK